MVNCGAVGVDPEDLVRVPGEESAAVSLAAGHIQNFPGLCKPGGKVIPVIVLQCKNRIRLMRDESLASEHKPILGVLRIGWRLAMVAAHEDPDGFRIVYVFLRPGGREVSRVKWQYMELAQRLFLENFAGLSHEGAAKWHWSLPLGLSFYVFQSLTYTLDVYRRQLKPTTNLLAYVASACFFPTTLAGPITRIADLLPQMERTDREVTPIDCGRAAFLIGMGLAKKYLIGSYGLNFDTPLSSGSGTKPLLMTSPSNSTSGS